MAGETTLVPSKKRNMKSRQSYRTTCMTRVNESEGKPLIFIFILNILLHDTYQVHKIVMEIEEWKQIFPGNYVKSFSRLLWSLLESSFVLYES